MNIHTITLYVVLVILVCILYKLITEFIELKLLYSFSYRLQSIDISVYSITVEYAIKNSEQINIPKEEKLILKALSSANYGQTYFNEKNFKNLLGSLGFENVIITPIEK